MCLFIFFHHLSFYVSITEYRCTPAMVHNWPHCQAECVNNVQVGKQIGKPCQCYHLIYLKIQVPVSVVRLFFEVLSMV